MPYFASCSCGSSESARSSDVLHPLTVAGGGEPLLAQDAPLHARAIGGALIEPGLGAPRFAGGPGFARGNRGVDRLGEPHVEHPALGLERDRPPAPEGLEHLAGLARRRAAGGRETRRERLQVGVEDRVVDGGDLGGGREPADR